MHTSGKQDDAMYLNNAFSKQPLEEAIQAMQPYLRSEFESPLTESDGAEKARATLRAARESVAHLLNASPDEVFFVSSGTEANNWALKGATMASGRDAKHIVISAIEHFSVYQAALFLKKQGVEVTIVGVDSEGRVDPDALARSVRGDTTLVSILSASDEIGVVQDLAAISALKHRYPDVCFHTDAIQYLCYEDLDLARTPFDLVSLSSNALYGPAGAAALYVRRGVRLVPLLHGGMQEEGMRPGNQSMALIAGFGAAARANLLLKGRWREAMLRWRERMFDLFDSQRVPVSGSRQHRLADNIHGRVDVDGEAMLTLLLEAGIRASTGSTCYSYAQKESHVLKALGVSPEESRGAILFTGGIYQNSADEDRLVACFQESLQGLRALKP